MDFEFNIEDQAFYDEVDRFFSSYLPDDWLEQSFYWPGAFGNVPLSEKKFISIQTELTKEIGKRGWLSLALPKEYGGESSMIRQAIVNDISCYYRIPVTVSASLICAPTLIEVGSEEMKKEWLPKICSGNVSFWLGYSEPNAGSDLSSVKTSAVETDGHFIINGQKTWSTGAHVNDYGWVLARTDMSAPNHEALSLFIIDNKSPGITIQPIINICGTHSFNDVFFDNVKVPKKNLVGKVNKGFKYLMLALEYERLACGSGAFRRFLEELISYVKNTNRNNHALVNDRKVRDKIAELATDVEILYCHYWRIAWMITKGKFAGHEASALKLIATELSRKMADMAIEIIGEYATVINSSSWTAMNGRVGMGYVDSISGPIGAGSSEIQRSIIATRGLGLPKR